MTKIKPDFRHILISLAIPVITAVTVFIAATVTNARVGKNVEITTSNLVETEKARKTLVLTKFFNKFKSPLVDNVDAFVDTAVKYDLDYKLLPAISCIESSCGKKLIPGTFNPFGWGIYGSNYISFESYDQAIQTVGEGIYKNYVAKGYDTPAKIAPIYTPPAHQHWLGSVMFFIKEMEKIETELEG